MKRDKAKWIVSCLGILIAIVLVPIFLLVGPLSRPNNVAGHLGAVLLFAGSLLTAAVSFISIMVKRESDQRLSQESTQATERLTREHEDEKARLRLEAAMQAGALFSSHPEPVQPASIASSLLALTSLDRADFAVALLVDFWSEAEKKVSTEAAILVIDSALRSAQPQARLVAAELLCRSSGTLDPCQSLHWPSVIDGCWDASFSPKTKLLLIEALLNMTLSRPVTESALRSIAVRLYGIYRDDKDPCVRGCVAKLINSLIKALDSLHYGNLMQGNQAVMISDLKNAARKTADNPDDFLNRLANHRSTKLAEWAKPLSARDHTQEDAPLAESVVNPVPVARAASLAGVAAAGNTGSEAG